jgi:hypothetical protein
VISIRRWHARQLIQSWIAYWFALLAFFAWRPILEYWRITRSASGHGSVNLTFSGDPLHGALWIAGPPLVIFLVWLATRTRTGEREQVPER